MERFITWVERWYTLFFGSILVGAILLRLPLLNGSFWLDEAAQALESTRPWFQQLDIAYDFQPPLFHLVVHLLSYVSKSEAWLRLASLVPAIGSVAIFMVLAKDRWGKAASLIGGVLLASSSFHVYFSQELRPYMFAAFFCLLGWLAYERWIWKPVGSSRVWKSIFVLSTVAACYASYVALFWFPVFALLTVIWRRQKIIVLLGTFLLCAVLYLPWLPGLWEQLQVGGALRMRLPGWEAVVSLPALKSLPLTFAKFWVGPQNVDLTVFQVFLLCLPLVIGALGLKNVSMKKLKSSDLLSVVILAVVPLLIVWLFSFITPVLAPKRIMYILPVWCALIVWLFDTNRKWGSLLVVLWCVFQAVGLVRYWTEPGLQREDWRGLIAQIEQRFPSEKTGVVMGFDEPFAPWRWYAADLGYIVVTTGLEPLQETERMKGAIHPVLAKEQLLVFDYLRDLTDPYRVIEASLEGAGYKQLTALDGRQIGFVRVFVQNRLYARR